MLLINMSKYNILKYIVRLVKSVNYLKAALSINKFKQLFSLLYFSSYTYFHFIKKITTILRYNYLLLYLNSILKHKNKSN